MSARCEHCKEERLIEVVRETAGGTKLITCAVCGLDSVQFNEQQIVCPECAGVGSHQDGCRNFTPWGV